MFYKRINVPLFKLLIILHLYKVDHGIGCTTARQASIDASDSDENDHDSGEGVSCLGRSYLGGRPEAEIHPGGV